MDGPKPLTPGRQLWIFVNEDLSPEVYVKVEQANQRIYNIESNSSIFVINVNDSPQSKKFGIENNVTVYPTLIAKKPIQRTFRHYYTEYKRSENWEDLQEYIDWIFYR